MGYVKVSSSLLSGRLDPRQGVLALFTKRSFSVAGGAGFPPRTLPDFFGGPPAPTLLVGLVDSPIIYLVIRISTKTIIKEAGRPNNAGVWEGVEIVRVLGAWQAPTATNNFRLPDRA